MPEAYSLAESRFIQHINGVSALNAHIALIGPVPAGKIWTILCAIGQCSADDTQDYWFGVYVSSVVNYSVTHPEEHAFDVSEANWIPMLREGMEIKLFPGEYLSFNRDGHVAGSTISIFARIIESDLPLFTYEEPQIVKRQKVALSTIKSLMSGGGSRGSGPGSSPGSIPRGGGGGRGIPV